MRGILLFGLLANGCQADDAVPRRPGQPVPASSVAAEEPAEMCPCENLGESPWDAIVSLECLCDNFRCPRDVSWDALTHPQPFLRIIEYTCPDDFFVIRRTSGWDGANYAFKGSGDESVFVGMNVFFDYPAFCGALSVEGGELPRIADCESCILSHRELVADPGECLDPNQLPEVNQDNPRPGVGGEGGAFLK